MSRKIFRIQVGEKTEYQVALYPDAGNSFAEQLDNLELKYRQLLSDMDLSNEALVFAKVFVSDYLNQRDCMNEHVLFKEHLGNCAVSVIEQPPLDGNKVNILLWMIQGTALCKKRCGDLFTVQTGSFTHVFHTLCCESSGEALEEATEKAFESHESLIGQSGMDVFNHCVRTWLYVRDIDNNYMPVVRGRNRFFDRHGLRKDTHFIASTGIEGAGPLPGCGLCMELYSVRGSKKMSLKYLKALNYLNPTHEYGVSFERGVCVTYPDMKHVFISGTASIDKHGQCIYRGDVSRQLDRVFLNIRHLLLDAGVFLSDVSCFIVYLRDASDYLTVSRYMEAHYRETPCVIVRGKVCRPEWLVEIECMALQKNSSPHAGDSFPAGFSESGNTE